MENKPQPEGFRFCPSDELLINFLKAKNNGAALPPSAPIRDFDLYSAHPSRIYDLTEDNWRQTKQGDHFEFEGYFFTSPEHISKTSKIRVERKVKGVGTWSYKSTVTRIVASDSGQEIGLRKQFRFVEKDPASASEEFKWIMHEYSLENNKDVVLCRIIKRRDNKKNETTHGESFLATQIDHQDGASRMSKRRCIDDSLNSFNATNPNFKEKPVHNDHLAHPLACPAMEYRPSSSTSKQQVHNNHLEHQLACPAMEYRPSLSTGKQQVHNDHLTRPLACPAIEYRSSWNTSKQQFHNDVLQDHCVPVPQLQNLDTVVLGENDENELFLSVQELLDDQQE